jgi:hypothetical protein
MRLRRPVQDTIDTLTRLKSQLQGVHGNNEQDVHDAWIRWWDEADTQLRHLFPDGDLAAELYVSAERVRASLNNRLPRFTINRETAVWVARFDDLIVELTALAPFIQRPGTIVVPDTSVFLEATYFTELAWHEVAGVASGELVRIVVPLLVIDELDVHKRGRDKVRDRARSVLRRMWDLGAFGGSAGMLPGRCATVEVFSDAAWHTRLPDNDAEIIDRAAAIGEITGCQVIMAASDYGMLNRALVAGLKARFVPHEQPAPASQQDQAQPPAP